MKWHKLKPYWNPVEKRFYNKMVDIERIFAIETKHSRDTGKFHIIYSYYDQSGTFHPESEIFDTEEQAKARFDEVYTLLTGNEFSAVL